MSTEMSPSTIGALVRPQPHDDFWSTDPERFDFDIDYGLWTDKYMAKFEQTRLWHQTCLQVVTAKKNESNLLDVQNSFLDEDKVMAVNSSTTVQEGTANTFELLQVLLSFIPLTTVLLTTSLGSSISWLLQKEEDQRHLPSEEYYLLRVSSRVLRHLASTYHIPSVFLVAVSRPQDFVGTAFRRQSQHEWDYWCQFPFRLAIIKGIQSEAQSNQIDPSFCIHFERQNAYIYGASITLYMKRDCKTGKTHVFVVNSGERNSTQPPLDQVQKSLERRSSVDLDQSPCFVLLIYVAFLLKWWKNALLLFNLELVDHERILQREIANETEGFLNTSKVLNAALHTMAAHLYRYKTELQRVDMVLSDLREYRKEMTYKPKPKRGDRGDRKQEEENEENQEEFPPIDRELQKIEQLALRLTAISNISDEMEKKVQNILALLFNQIQAINDKTLQAILNASQQENRISQKLSLASHMLSRSMKRDSIAMKTIAIMTLVFLPEATFAAVFAMPFFTENKYLSSPSQVWIWVILTAICTAFAFGGYIHVVKRGESTLGDLEDDNDTTISSAGTTASNTSSAVGNGENTSPIDNKQHWWQRVSQRASKAVLN
ncbi:hypothetical protein LCI18_011195 [Fusarium solani-melongenae]|uniref:Uncharacterized protein n=1 Tax=Fusarium solani subsp. cucurbitae TaxID=2747967 RepID=A0ACD3ZGB3_FUSSC|nr:hypothetical protein LCI18_011195 [Fusarium solani-melongenae]